MLFAGTSTGAIRSYKFPLTTPGEWQEHQAHSASITKVWFRFLMKEKTLRENKEYCCCNNLTALGYLDVVSLSIIKLLKSSYQCVFYSVKTVLLFFDCICNETWNI